MTEVMTGINFVLTLSTITVLVSGQGSNIPYLTDANTNNGVTQLVDSIKSLVDCIAEPVTYDKHLGTLTGNYSYYCTAQTQRVPPGVFCCTPQASDEIRLLVSIPNKGEQEVKFWDEKGASLLANEKKVVYLAHGWIEKIATSPWLNVTRDGYLKRGYAVVVVDWGHLNQISYWQSIANLRTVGAAMGYSILKWGIHEKALVVGFSLGGQIVAEAGKYVNQNGNGKKIAECHGLDPAGPWFDPFYGFLPDMELDKSDCNVVQVVHTSASYNPSISMESTLILKLGTAFKSGHCDFWINCGHDQGDLCHGDFDMVQFIRDISTSYKDGGNALVAYFAQHVCSHYRASMMYADAVNKKCPGKKYPMGSICTDCGPRIPSPKGYKYDCTPRQEMGREAFPPDNVCTPQDDVNYVVFSTDTPPFCQGTQ